MDPASRNLDTGSAARSKEIDQLKELIVKLRWLGMEDEAQRVCLRLSRIAPTAKVLNEPLDTD